ncbi:MAG: hypothetical protein QXJ53_00075 [Candidatus Bathyarchaeia archaeon]
MPVVDDIIIYGSTMKTVVDKLKEQVGVTSRSYCMVYDMDKARFKDVEAQKYLHSDEVATFCHEIVQAFSTIGMPYDIDHPIFFLNDISLQHLKRIEEKWDVSEITTSIQETHGILNLVVHPEKFPALNELFNQRSCDFYLSMHKVRLHYDIRKCRLCITPIVLFGLRIKDYNSPIFKMEYLNQIIWKAVEIFHKNGLSTDEIEEAIYRLTCYIVEYIYGLLFLYDIQSAFDKDLIWLHLIRQKDVNLLFGDSFGRFLVENLEAHKYSLISILAEKRNSCQTDKTCLGNKIENEELFQELFKGEKYRDFNNILRWNDEVECIWNVCLLMQRKDILTRDPGKITPNRLKFGFSFDDLLRIIRNHCPNSQARTLSLILDCFIDRGIIVPLFLKYPNGYYVRAFRFGESAEKRRAYFMKDVLEFLFKNIKLKSISQFDFEKLFSYLHDVFTKILSQDAHITYKSLDIVKGYDEYGARVFARAFLRMEEEEPGEASPLGSKPLFEEALENYLLKKTPKGKYELGDKEIIDKLYPPDRDPLKHILGDVLLYVSFFAELCFGKDRPIKRKDEVALLLTTCNNPVNFLSTYGVGIHAWFEHPHVRYSLILNAIKKLAYDKSEDENQWKEIEEMLENLARRIRQCEKKMEVWLKAPFIVEEIDKWSKSRFYTEGLWLKIKNGLLDHSPFKEKEQIIYDYTLWLYEITRLHINLLRSALKYCIFGASSQYADNLKIYIDTYNRVIKRNKEFCSLQTIEGDVECYSDKFQILLTLVETLDSNANKLYDIFKEVKQYEKKEAPRVEYLDHDMAIVRYDLLGYSDWVRSERERIICIIDKQIKPFLDSLGEGKYYYSVFNDEHSWPLSSIENALKVSQKFLEVMRAENKYCRIVIHYTSPNNRIQIYKGETGKVLGGDSFIITGRLVEIAEKLQKSREKLSNVILITEDAYQMIPSDIRNKLNIKGPFESQIQGKSIGKVKYYEISEGELKNIFSPTIMYPSLESFKN